MNIWLTRICKTASTSLEYAFRSISNFNVISKGHGKPKQQKIPNNFLKVACIRNPFDRLVSGYLYIIQVKRKKWENGDHRLDWVFNEKSFKSFCLNLPNTYRNNQFFHLQTEWIYDDDDNLMIDKIFKFENLEEDWKSFLKDNNIPYKKLPTKRKTKRTHWTDYYDTETMEVIYNLYQNDFNKLGYTL